MTHAADNAHHNHQPAIKWPNASNVFSAKEEILPRGPRLAENSKLPLVDAYWWRPIRRRRRHDTHELALG